MPHAQLAQLPDGGGLPPAAAQGIMDAPQEMHQDILKQMQRTQEQMQEQMQQQMQQLMQQMQDNHAAVMAKLDKIEQRWSV